MANSPDKPRPGREPDAPPRLEQVAHARFWSAYYREGYVPWDMGHENPVFRALREAGALPAGKRVWVPGCGTGYDALALAKAGYEVTAVDFAPEPLATLAELARAAGLDKRLRIVEADVFDLPAGFHAAFDWALEYT